MQMTCPKCHGEMRQYERSGVTVDQCTECRGIFLDRGELEKLFDAEANWNQAHAASRPSTPPPAPPPPPPSHAPAQPVQHGYPAPAYGSQYGYRGHYRGHYRHGKRKGFLHELFD
jgi:Zn-finger nucleic acid-binding protein